MIRVYDEQLFRDVRAIVLADETFDDYSTMSGEDLAEMKRRLRGVFDRIYNDAYETGHYEGSLRS